MLNQLRDDAKKLSDWHDEMKMMSRIPRSAQLKVKSAAPQLSMMLAQYIMKTTRLEAEDKDECLQYFIGETERVVDIVETEKKESEQGFAPNGQELVVTDPFAQYQRFMGAIPHHADMLSGIFGVNREVRNETLAMYYGTAIILLPVNRKKEVSEWLEANDPAHRAHMRYLRFDVHLNSSSQRADRNARSIDPLRIRCQFMAHSGYHSIAVPRIMLPQSK